MSESHGASVAQSPRRIAFLAATEFESHCVERGLRASFMSSVPATAAVCISCGIGCGIDSALQSLEQYRCVVSVGFAAGLRGDARAGTLLLPRRICKETTTAFTANAEWHTKLSAAIARPPAAGTPVSTEPMVHTGRIAATPGDKRALAQGGKFVGADMESALIAAACESGQVPFVALRVILDPIDATVPDAILAIVERAAKPRPAALLAELTRRPRDLPHVIRFLCLTIAARNVLTSTITRVMTGLEHRAAVQR